MYLFLKRSFDLVFSLLALILLLPLFILVAAGIKLSSRGPVLYQSERIGLSGKPFNMLKFRSMHQIREGVQEAEYLVNEDRIFPFGRFIRKSKLDELPQLVNVLLSHMSIVGPRPYPKEVTDRDYTGEYVAILSVKPGLAGFDSLFDYTHGELFVTDEEEYANNILPVRTELAAMYVERRGIRTDAGIIARTISLIWQIVVLRRTSFGYSRTEQEAVGRVHEKKHAKVTD